MKSMFADTTAGVSMGVRADVSRYFAREGVDPLGYAFDTQVGPHAGFMGQPVPSEHIHSAWNSAAEQVDSSKRRAVYIHVPFCQNRCAFCSFYMNSSGALDSLQYTDALIKEMGFTACRPAAAGHPIHSVYLGGGTPTDLEPVDLERLLTEIRKTLPLANDCEITVEGRVAGFTPDKMRACINGGANRFSIGVQSFNTEIRRRVGRKVDKAAVISALGTLCSMDNAAVVIDLIYGLPGQTMKDWEEDIETLIRDTDLDGADLYKLKLVPGSPLLGAVQTGRFPALMDTPEMGRMFKRGVEMMTESRFRRLSICHWGRGTRERNRYNTDNQYGGTCIPFGCGAGGKLHGFRFVQETDLETYYQRIEFGEKPVAMAMQLPDNSSTYEEITGQVSQLAINLGEIGPKGIADIEQKLEPLIAQWERAGLVIRRGDWVELTTAGQFWNVHIAQALLEWLAVPEET